MTDVSDSGGPDTDIQKFQLRRRVVTSGEPIEINDRIYHLRRDLKPKLMRTIGLMQSRVDASQQAVRACAARIDELSAQAEAAPEDAKEALYTEQLEELAKVDRADNNTRRWLIATLDLFIEDVDDDLRDDLREVESISDVMAIVGHVTSKLGFARAATDAEVEGLDPTERPSPTSSLPPPSSPPSSVSTGSS